MMHKKGIIGIEDGDFHQ